MTEDFGVWVYLVADRIAPQWVSGLAGVGGEPVREVRSSGLSGAVTTVSLAEFGEQALRQHLENLDWLEAAARIHHTVIGAVARHVPVVPMRLATVYRGDARVAAMLAQRHDDVVAALSRIKDRTEWGVKVSVAPAAPPSGPAASAADSGGAGAAFLRRRRTQLAASENARSAAAASAERIHHFLGRLAAASQLRAPQAPQLTGRAERMILNGAYLVDDARSAEFSAAVSRLAEQHADVRMELTGPWPPYSFASGALHGSATENGDAEAGI